MYEFVALLSYSCSGRWRGWGNLANFLATIHLALWSLCNLRNRFLHSFVLLCSWRVFHVLFTFLERLIWFCLHMSFFLNHTNVNLHITILTHQQYQLLQPPLFFHRFHNFLLMMSYSFYSYHSFSIWIILQN